jgi:hypothetical protein
MITAEFFYRWEMKPKKCGYCVSGRCEDDLSQECIVCGRDKPICGSCEDFLGHGDFADEGVCCTACERRAEKKEEKRLENLPAVVALREDYDRDIEALGERPTTLDALLTYSYRASLLRKKYSALIDGEKKKKENCRLGR